MFDSHYEPAIDTFAYGWPALQSPEARPLPTWGTQPSIGAVPQSQYTPDVLFSGALIKFIFTSFDGTILNATVVGLDGQHFFHITTDSSSSCRTVIEDSNGQRVGTITWKTQPTVSVDEFGWTKPAAQWLYISSDKTRRVMTAGGQQFIWWVNGGCIELFSLDINPQLFARISQNMQGTVLQLTLLAIQQRLLQDIVISSVLLMSGRNIN
ncbi:hypothetical protein B0H10DRAFT_1332276 [Mycena sp. CBHHK59/15]|nr:hypothetical protein B0H10DRAFT_1332276 [Mycena sp. CBHHK59/15]